MIKFPYFCVVVLAACTGVNALAAEVIPLTVKQIKSLGITTVQPVRGAAGSIGGLPARVMIPNAQQHVVSTPLEGLVQRLAVAVGQPVRRGEILARLHSPDLVEAQRAFLQALTQLSLAQGNLSRDERLYKEGIIPESRLRATRSTQQEAVAMLEERQQFLRLAGMSAKSIDQLKAKRLITNTLTLASPVNGVVLEQLATIGQRLEANSPVYKVAQLDPLWLEVQVPANRIGEIKLGANVAVPRFEAAGKVSVISRSVDSDSQTVMLRALIDKNTHNLRAGQNVEAVIASTSGETGSAWRVPNAAVVHNGSSVIVFTRTPTGFQSVEVKLLQAGTKGSTLSATFTPATEIAVTGTAALKAMSIELGSE